jgi:hypothetical protein
MKAGTGTAAAPKTDPVRVVDMVPLSFRAEIVMPQTINDETREVELIFTTGAPVQRYDWMSDKRYLETLSLDPKHVRIDRLNAGGPLLDSHSAWSVADMLGAVVPGSVTLTKNQGRCTVRFSKRESVQGIWQDVKDGLIRSVSVGYRVYKFEETQGKGNALPVRLATDWEPFEVSMVPIPADAGAATRGAKPQDTNQCEIVTRAEAPSDPKERAMDGQGQGQSEFIDEVPVRAAAPTPAAPALPVEPNERDTGVSQENARIQGILTAVRAARLPQSVADKLIKDTSMSLVRAQTYIFEELAKRDAADVGPRAGASGAVVVGDDPVVHKRSAIQTALLHRAAPELRGADGKVRFPLTDEAAEYRGMGLMDIARVLLNARGVRTTHMSKIELAGAALGIRGGMHTTSDFAQILADVQGKVLRAAYEEAPQTWRPLARRVVLSDFKPSKQLQLGDAPNLLEVQEHGEFKRGTIAEAKEQFQLATYGRVFAITRQALINDDTDAFSRIPMEFGRASRRKESDLAWAQITSNPAMGDNVALFHADHDNLASVAAAIAIGPMGIARAALRKQTGLDGTTLLNLSAKYLVVPAALETVADQLVSTALLATVTGAVNPFAGRLTVISEPRLDASSATAWYVTADPSQIDILLYGVLEGQEGPMVDTRVGFDVDGIEVKCRLDTAFKAADWRGLFKNAGV